jgi:hypothetical protein
MKLKWEFWTTEGENIIHDQKMEGGSSKNEELNEEGKYKN